MLAQFLLSDYCMTSMDMENRGGLPDPDPDLSKSRGGHPESRDEKVGENRDLSRLFSTNLDLSQITSKF